jgi:hypothetical protein
MLVHRNTTHGLSKHKAYRVWCTMRSRCTHPSQKQFKDWGGRGIKVCDRWQAFENFWEDMGLGWAEGLMIERIDNDLDYQPGNCRWATRIEQANNKRHTVWLDTPRGRMSMANAARAYGIPRAKIRSRYYRSKPMDDLWV